MPDIIQIIIYGFAIFGAWCMGSFIIACIAARLFRGEDLGHFHGCREFRLRKIVPLPNVSRMHPGKPYGDLG